MSFRGDCPRESAEHITFFSELRRRYPDTLGTIAIHPANEARRRGKEFRKLTKDKAMGLSSGASDIIIPGAPSFVCELKRRDYTKCRWQPGQLEYLQAAHDAGAFVCVALGWEAAMVAVESCYG
jgi:hypothetical protein